jgi:prepilin-type N-terminal cleavage/methylation domain-containing protein
MTPKYKNPPSRTDRGLTLIEVTVVMAIALILGAIALPQVTAVRRLWRSAGVSREIVTQLRLARQQAMSQRRAFTFQLDDENKQIVIIRHDTSGNVLLADPNYPNNLGSVQINTIPIDGQGVNGSEIVYGIPSDAPTDPLGDDTTLHPLDDGKVNVTFQPDGSVIDAAGNPTSAALFIYNSQAPNDTAVAISILGSGGRIKLWRYSANVDQYVE